LCSGGPGLLVWAVFVFKDKDKGKIKFWSCLVAWC